MLYTCYMQFIYTEHVIYRLYNGTCYIHVLCRLYTRNMLYTGSITEHVIYMLCAGYIHGTWLRAGLLPCANLCCTLNLNTMKQSFQKDGLPFDDKPSNKFWKQKDQQFRRCNRSSHISIISALRVTLTLNIATHFFGMTPQLMTMYHHARFGNKRFRSSEDIIKTNIN